MLNVPPDLRTRLGQDASEDLIDMFANQQAFATDRFERRLTESNAELRRELIEGFARIRVEMANMRTDVIRWNLLFWVGQFAAVVAALAMMLDR